MFTGKEYFYPFFKVCIKKLTCNKDDIVLDLGTYWPLRKELEKFQDEFHKIKYFSLDYKIDISKHRNNPDIDGDICYLPFKSNSVDGLICKDVLEHVKAPLLAIDEMYRVLKNGGKLFSTVPFIHPYHGSMTEKSRDYWRFSRDAVELLFCKFEHVTVERAGGLLYILKNFVPSPFFLKLFFNFLSFPIINFLDRRVFKVKNVANLWMIFAIK